jgi:hypothetical protein
VSKNNYQFYQLNKLLIMKKSLVIMITLFFASLNIQAQEKPINPQDSIIFLSIVHDYGTIVQGSDGSCEFRFTNKGKVPIVLNDVKASCGCTTPEWTRTPVAPGEKGIIKVTYNTNNVGAFGKSITVSSNAKNSPVVLTIKGNVTPKQ